MRPPSDPAGRRLTRLSNMPRRGPIVEEIAKLSTVAAEMWLKPSRACFRAQWRQILIMTRSTGTGASVLCMYPIFACVFCWERGAFSQVSLNSCQARWKLPLTRQGFSACSIVLRHLTARSGAGSCEDMAACTPKNLVPRVMKTAPQTNREPSNGVSAYGQRVKWKRRLRRIERAIRIFSGPGKNRND
jgi:hypothetical protein